MYKSLKSWLALLVVLCIQVAVYLIFFHSFILKWGATDDEGTMPMPGDRYAEAISCTRAIDIDKASEEVWPFLVDLGADRRGFYSYGFLERLYGCEITTHPILGNREMNIGRIIPYQLSNDEGNNTEGFKVVEAEQGESFVLQGWGGFLLKKTGENTSRLIIRTHWKTSHNVFERFWGSVFDMGHYIMEKRMMLGIKDYAESNGTKYTVASDLIWFLGVVISGLAGLFLTFICTGCYKLILPAVYITIWQFSFLVLHPRPLIGIGLVLLVSGCFILNKLYLKNMVNG